MKKRGKCCTCTSWMCVGVCVCEWVNVKLDRKAVWLVKTRQASYKYRPFIINKNKQKYIRIFRILILKMNQQIQMFILYIYSWVLISQYYYFLLSFCSCSWHLSRGLRRRLVCGSGKRSNDLQGQRKPTSSSLQMDQVCMSVCVTFPEVFWRLATEN